MVIQTSNEIKFTVDYYLALGRWSFFNGENVKMKNINDLNASMIYNITPAISLNVRAVSYTHLDVYKRQGNNNTLRVSV